MTIRIALNHQTKYRYARPASLGPQVVRLRPAPHCRTPILSYSLKVQPPDHFINWQQDPFGNFQARIVFPEKVRELSIEIDLIADMSVINPFDFFVEPSADDFPFKYEDLLGKDLLPFLECAPRGPRLSEFLKTVDCTKRYIAYFLVDLNQLLQKEIEYAIRMEPGVQTCEETLTLKKGSCRDTAWLLVQILRQFGLAARFVSGYLIQLIPDIKALDGPVGSERDFTDLHAWAEVFIPGAGWIGLDPTSGLFAGEGHIPVACTPDPSTAAPVSGGVEAVETEFDFSMSIQRIHEDPRVTKPYSEEQWQQIDAVGKQVDERLERGDVRLTMGGEPTFVSIDDMEADEWTTAAVGPTKRRLAAELLLRLQQRFAPNSLLHFGQGKWYPGEPLPRWAFSCYWRTDRQPVWLEPALVAEEGKNYGHKNTDAKRFVDELATRLEVSPKCAMPAYEDAWHYIDKERKLAVNVDPSDSKLKNVEERVRLARLVEQGLGEVSGYVLPLKRQWWQAKARWESSPWPIRSGVLFLLPGDSPIGLRLPMESLPWTPPSRYGDFFPTDPTAPREPLPEHPGRRPLPEHAHSETGLNESASTHPPTSPQSIVRTALCIEPREGRLHVFMPPTERLEDYLDLLTAVEDTAMATELPIVVEGYTPPHDPRISHVSVTPDPGVIEVNIHPARSWDELTTNTTILYEEARQTRLGTEKYDLDGRHTGTGGGNHIVLGGKTPLDSPFLRRPDLLKSLVSYWNNHPALSYLFSSGFIGPTSQAPRVDEGRRDAIYELEIACQQVPDPAAGNDISPWVVDRIFRHLLVDLTGNTHRAEFCIDKLYSPDSSTGRLGLVEFRGFEMPPHARMSLTQQLLLRALVARFWDQPYREKLVNWGTTLHDRYLLPHFVHSDLRDVIAETRDFGIPLELDWFASHFEFRFPAIGTIQKDDVKLELRQAIEPWYVLGEEPGGGGTARYVDSSVERMQVKVSGMTDSRHIVTCNGRKLPLHATGQQGEFVAAVRYRAWQPPSCLHPTIPVHSPLVFDLVDSWNRRSIGGCTYHVSHPGGRHYDNFPINSYEAESRRASRFFASGHTGGPIDIAVDEPNPQYPLTLDLHRARQLMTSVPIQPAPPAASHIFGNYSPLTGVYDEMLDSAGSIRPSWQPFADAIETLGRDEVARRWQQAREEVRENGITYNAYEDVNGNTRPWELDAFPLVISPEEWSELALGLRQRAELLDRVLRDLFGPQTLLQRGLLPADWLYSHPGFHREFHKQGIRDGRFLHLYAVDLARDPDGCWWVAGDRTDAPLGVGYALENRVVMSRMLPKVMHDCKVERLAPFFISLRKTLSVLASHRENPRIVILSQGPSGPNYFEDAYLARYLGYTLVEGGDLAVRDDRVSMKTLAGLLPVDVIFRRLSDEYCDPLELRGEASFGVPGLLQAARLGNVAIANSLGSSIVESPSLMPFLACIASEWMGEELLLPSAATWWCGQKPAQADVRSRLGKISVRAAYRVARRENPAPESLWSKSADELSRLIEARPRDLIGQEQVSRSCSPVWREGACDSQRVALRVFLVATKDSYHVMPGGLVCMASTSAPLDLSVLAGEVSKDAWVLSHEPVRPVTLLSSAKQKVELRRTGAELPSRVADNLFWLGRHIERAQNACRLLRPVVSRLTSESGSENLPDLAVLVHSLAQHGLVEPGFAVESMRELMPTISQVLPTTMLDASQPDSLRSMFTAAHRNAGLVRDRLSLDSWRILHRVKREFETTTATQRFGLAELLDLLNDLIGDLAAFDGLIGESMTRTPAWRFLELGRRLERSQHTLALVQSLFAVSSENDARALEAVLEVADSIMTYRGRYLAGVHLAPVLDLLLTDETNPRSLVFQLEAIADHVEHLPRDQSQPLRGADQRIALSMLHSARMLDPDALQEHRASAKSTPLERVLTRISTQLPKLSDLIGHRYLIHADLPRQMSESRP